MKYRFEYNGNPDCVTLHLTVRLMDEDFVNSGVDATSTITQELFNLCKGTLGASDISLKPYAITLTRGSAFDRDEVLENLLERIKPWLSFRHGVEDYTQLPTLRSDLMYRKCPECQAEDDKAWRELARDMDTREY